MNNIVETFNQRDEEIQMQKIMWQSCSLREKRNIVTHVKR